MPVKESSLNMTDSTANECWVFTRWKNLYQYLYSRHRLRRKYLFWLPSWQYNQVTCYRMPCSLATLASHLGQTNWRSFWRVGIWFHEGGTTFEQPWITSTCCHSLWKMITEKNKIFSIRIKFYFFSMNILRIEWKKACLSMEKQGPNSKVLKHSYDRYLVGNWEEQ